MAAGGTRRRAVLHANWTKARENAFLEHLALSSNVAASERVARMTPGSAYRRRRRDAAFEEAWLAALRQGYAQLEHAMLERALRGVPVVRVARDGTRTETIEYPDRVAITLLNAHRATATGGAAGGAPAGVGTGVGGAGAKARLVAKLTDMRERTQGGE